jgi:hypothetical protein
MMTDQQAACFRFSKEEHIQDYNTPKQENSTNKTINRTRARLQYSTNSK